MPPGASDRDWERELAAIDQRLASVPDAPPPAREAPRAGPPARATAPPIPALATPAPEPAARRGLGTPPAAPGRRSWRAQLALLFWLALGVAAVVALIAWPYPARCGAGLGYYLALVAGLAAAGLATSASAWKHRAPFVHVLGLAMVAGAAVLGARDVLPRVGYAIPTAEHPASWACAVDPQAPAAPAGAPAAR